MNYEQKKEVITVHRSSFNVHRSSSDTGIVTVADERDLYFLSNHLVAY